MLFSCNEQHENEIIVQGLVDAKILTIKSRIPGNIIELNLKEGQKLKRGDIVARIDDSKINNKIQTLLLEEENLENLKKRLNKNLKLAIKNLKFVSKQKERFYRLNRKMAISGERYEEMEIKYERVATGKYQLERDLDDLNLNSEKLKLKQKLLLLTLQDYVIKAPFDCLVIERIASFGEYVFPASPLGDIIDIKNMFVEVFLEEEEIGKLSVGDEAEIWIDGLEGSFTGRIAYFARKAEFSPKYVISEVERKVLLYQVKIRIQDKDIQVFKVGMPVTIKIK
jgi:HlyD family secretion protein